MEAEAPNQVIFRNEAGTLFEGVSPEGYQSILAELAEHYGVCLLQVSEAASYSMAMVIRVASGLSVSGAKVGTIVSDSLAGWTALATLRHLACSGCECTAVLLAEENATALHAESQLERQLKPLKQIGVPILNWENEEQNSQIEEEMLTWHSAMIGAYPLAPSKGESALKNVIDCVNEQQTPVHALLCPVGVDPHTGGRQEAGVLFAASTLSLGIPLVGTAAGSEYVGRHYICDISIPAPLYAKYSIDLTSFFAEQPVIQIFTQPR